MEQGLQGKNMRLFLGKPLIAWTIGQAKKSKYIDKLIVSTNDEKIAKISIEHGANIPYMRPEEEDIQCVEKPN
jgi:CMP-N-acetylneuraminic acid synthetase|tara:strand:+ start:263 stop:481 length:219 start_codon:yes stop_codon:yes gene_type:complete